MFADGQLLPTWFPSDELFLALLALIVLVLLMNRGEWWFFNVKAQDEPLLSAIGVAIFLLGWSGWLTSHLGVFGDMVWMALGAVVALSGVFIYRSERFDISGLI